MHFAWADLPSGFFVLSTCPGPILDRVALVSPVYARRLKVEGRRTSAAASCCSLGCQLHRLISTESVYYSGDFARPAITPLHDVGFLSRGCKTYLRFSLLKPNSIQKHTP